MQCQAEILAFCYVFIAPWAAVCYSVFEKGSVRVSFGDRLKEARQKAGLTQSELASKLKVSAAMIAQYETGKRNPKKGTLAKLAEALEWG